MNFDLKNRINENFNDLSELNGEELKNKLDQKMLSLFKELKENNLDKMQILKEAMSYINGNIIRKKEQDLYSLIAKSDEISKMIISKRNEIKDTLRVSFETAESLVNANDIERKDEILAMLNSAILRETRMLNILNESVQSAFLTTIENGVNIQETAMQIAKNISFNAINDAELSSERIIEISRTITLAAIEVANESHIYAKELINGAIEGTRDGIIQTLENLKNSAKFSPTETGLAKIIKDLRDIEDKFIQLIKDVGEESAEPSRSAIENLLDESLDSNIAKLKRMSEQAAEELAQKIEELKANVCVNEFLASTSAKFEKLKGELNERTKNINLNENLKELEKKTSEKIEEIKHLDIKQEAKKFGDRAYNVAKDFLVNIKNPLKNEKDEKNDKDNLQR